MRIKWFSNKVDGAWSSIMWTGRTRASTFVELKMLPDKTCKNMNLKFIFHQRLSKDLQLKLHSKKPSEEKILKSVVTLISLIPRNVFVQASFFLALIVIWLMIRVLCDICIIVIWLMIRVLWTWCIAYGLLQTNKFINHQTKSIKGKCRQIVVIISIKL